MAGWLSISSRVLSGDKPIHVNKCVSQAASFTALQAATYSFWCGSGKFMRINSLTEICQWENRLIELDPDRHKYLPRWRMIYAITPAIAVGANLPSRSVSGNVTIRGTSKNAKVIQGKLGDG